jgi:hypothetical protein
MTNRKLAQIAGFIVFLVMATAVGIGVALSKPKVGDDIGVLMICDSKEVLEKIFKGGSDEVAVTLFNEAREEGQCFVLSTPVQAEISKVYPPFVDHSGDLIYIIQADGVVYTFNVEKLPGA